MVCTGNLCRSPMAEALLRHELDARGCTDVEVASAGTWAGHDHPATSDAVRVVGDLGVDLQRHASRPLSASDVERADLVIAMTGVHVREITALAPGAVDKIRLMKELREIEIENSGPRETVAGRLDALLAGKRPHPRRSLDVDDPMGLPRSAYERCATELRDGISALVGVLCPDTQGSEEPTAP